MIALKESYERKQGIKHRKLQKELMSKKKKQKRDSQELVSDFKK